MHTLNISRLGLSCVLVLGMAQAAHAAQRLLPATTSDQVPTLLSTQPAPKGVIERKPVTFAWALDPTAALTQPAPLAADSREYWQTVDAATLAKGVDLPMTTAGALIRISPAQGAAPLPADALSFTAGRRSIAIAQLADAQSLQQAGMPVSNGTQVLRLGAGSGAGHVQLRAANARGNYVVHVFEPTSDIVLNAQANRNAVLAGQTMRVSIVASRAAQALPLQAQALLVAPDGSNAPVKVQRATDGSLEAIFTPALRNNRVAGLWELQVFGMLGDTPRDVRTAFAVGQPTARFNGSVAQSADLHVSLPVQAASAGRYEARGTLYATAPDGQLRAVSEAHAAAWMQPGQHTLQLPFSKAHLPSGYGAPYELQQLELHDQSRMAPLEIRAHAARF